MKEEMKIMNRRELMQQIKSERKLYLGSEKIRFDYKFRRILKYEICHYICLMRTYEYLCYRRECATNFLASKYWVMKVKLCDRKKNQLGMKLGIEIRPNCIGNNVRVYHQNVIINGKVGENCIFHGNNVIGNKRTGAINEVPKLGSRVDVGVGAMVIGDVTIADDCIIGAGAVVTKSFLKPGTVIVGVPAKEVNQ